MGQGLAYILAVLQHIKVNDSSSCV